jgi:hypothetical protein
MGNKSGKKSSASNSIAETSRAHAQNVKNNPGISLGEATKAQKGMQMGDLGILGSMIDELAGFGQSMAQGNPMQKMMASYMGLPVEMDYGKLGLSEMIAKLMPQEEETTPAAGQPTVGYNPADAFAHLSPEQKAAIGRHNLPGGFM